MLRQWRHSCLPSGTQQFTSVFSGYHVAQALVFWVVFRRPCLWVFPLFLFLLAIALSVLQITNFQTFHEVQFHDFVFIGRVCRYIRCLKSKKDKQIQRRTNLTEQKDKQWLTKASHKKLNTEQYELKTTVVNSVPAPYWRGCGANEQSRTRPTYVKKNIKS